MGLRKGAGRVLLIRKKNNKGGGEGDAKGNKPKITYWAVVSPGTGNLRNMLFTRTWCYTTGWTAKLCRQYGGERSSDPRQRYFRDEVE